ncbi:hypothetical protein Xbud_03314 [Xenorhabdus budapestensis]|uniref:Uncharacterized protein n=1 Tax=Xenorhabdus budapestensis TaxID=290110 RepID=A0A2D0IR55_XENBU|nr:hypothetical protein Xbud_03314 [Xenorhabdus budapestensis]
MKKIHSNRRMSAQNIEYRFIYLFASALTFQASSEFIRVSKYRINRSELFLNSDLRTAFWHGFTSAPLILTFQLIHFILSQFQHRTQTFIINNLPLVNTVEFIEYLIFQLTVVILKRQCTVQIVVDSDVFTGNP